MRLQAGQRTIGLSFSQFPYSNQNVSVPPYLIEYISKICMLDLSFY
jgi:hypothetical protein